MPSFEVKNNKLLKDGNPFTLKYHETADDKKEFQDKGTSSKIKKAEVEREADSNALYVRIKVKDESGRAEERKFYLYSKNKNKEARITSGSIDSIDLSKDIISLGSNSATSIQLSGINDDNLYLEGETIEDLQIDAKDNLILKKDKAKEEEKEEEKKDLDSEEGTDVQKKLRKAKIEDVRNLISSNYSEEYLNKLGLSKEDIKEIQTILSERSDKSYFSDSHVFQELLNIQNVVNGGNEEVSLKEVTSFLGEISDKFKDCKTIKEKIHNPIEKFLLRHILEKTDINIGGYKTKFFTKNTSEEEKENQIVALCMGMMIRGERDINTLEGIFAKYNITDKKYINNILLLSALSLFRSKTIDETNFRNIVGGLGLGLDLDTIVSQAQNPKLNTLEILKKSKIEIYYESSIFLADGFAENCSSAIKHKNNGEATDNIIEDLIFNDIAIEDKSRAFQHNMGIELIKDRLGELKKQAIRKIIHEAGQQYSYEINREKFSNDMSILTPFEREEYFSNIKIKYLDYFKSLGYSDKDIKKIVSFIMSSLYQGVAPDKISLNIEYILNNEPLNLSNIEI